MVRKNPLGAIAAFKAAFGESRGHLFVLKLSGTEDYPRTSPRYARLSARRKISG
jgi:hypothetical protein